MGGRPMPALDFVSPQANRAAGDLQEQNVEATQGAPKKRKLFVHRQDFEDE